MSVAEHKQVVTRFIEDVWGRGDLALSAELLHDDLVDHMPLPGQAPGRAGHEDVVRMVAEAFPDRRLTLQALVAEGDRVVDRWTFEATHTGDFMGIPGTGRRVHFHGIDITRLEDGKIREIWHVEELLSILHQIGAVPPPGA